MTRIEQFNLAELHFSIAVLCLKEKQGTNLIEEMDKYTLRISKKIILKASAWLKHSGIIGYCSKLIDANPMESVPHTRFYFTDLGIANYFIKSTGMAD